MLVLITILAFEGSNWPIFMVSPLSSLNSLSLNSCSTIVFGKSKTTLEGSDRIKGFSTFTTPIPLINTLLFLGETLSRKNLDFNLACFCSIFGLTSSWESSLNAFCTLLKISSDSVGCGLSSDMATAFSKYSLALSFVSLYVWVKNCWEGF